MIKIIIQTNGEKILDNFEKENSTLIENSLILRRLEEIKKELLDIEYESEKLEWDSDEEE